MIIWGEAKRQKNLAKHGTDLAELENVFDFPMLTVEDDRLTYGKQRLQSLALPARSRRFPGLDRAA